MQMKMYARRVLDEKLTEKEIYQINKEVKLLEVQVKLLNVQYNGLTSEENADYIEYNIFTRQA